MQLGVSAKIFVGYTVLVLAFAATSIFTLVYLHRARQQVVVTQHFFEVQAPVDRAARLVADFPAMAPSSTRPPRPAPLQALTLAQARDHLESALAVLQRAMAEQSSASRRQTLEHYQAELGTSTLAVESLREQLGVVAAGTDEAATRRFHADLVKLRTGLQHLARKLRGEWQDTIADLAASEAWAGKAALGLGAAGVLAAIAAALFMLRTLRPLRVLRQHTRQIAGGDYARRTGISSHDEIGDLAREFDAMAGAILARQQDLIRSERLATVGRMAAHITHEIRNPLASIGLNVDLLGDEMPPDSTSARQLLTSIAAEVDRLSEITETYLRFVRLPRPRLGREDLGAAVKSAIEFSRAELQRAGVAVELSIGPGVLEVAGDENQLRQAILNLVRNAREAMPAGGRLRVDVTADAPNVLLGISDTGGGIAPADLGKVFEPFYSTKTKGTGLGLAAVLQVVTEHRGRIAVQSPPGGGCQFVVTLPAYVAEAGPAAESAAPSRDQVADPVIAQGNA